MDRTKDEKHSNSLNRGTQIRLLLFTKKIAIKTQISSWSQERFEARESFGSITKSTKSQIRRQPSFTIDVDDLQKVQFRRSTRSISTLTSINRRIFLRVIFALLLFSTISQLCCASNERRWSRSLAEASRGKEASETTFPLQIESVLTQKEANVRFNRYAFLGNTPFVSREVKSEVFRLNRTVQLVDLRFTCNAALQMANSTNVIPLPTFWIDRETKNVVSDGQELHFDSKAVDELEHNGKALYRCAAHLRVPSLKLNAVLFSRPILVIAANEPTVNVWPLRLNVSSGHSIRLECKHNGSLIPTPPLFHWTHNGEPLRQKKQVEVFDVGDRSVVYITAATDEHVGLFGCEVVFADGRRIEKKIEVQVFENGSRVRGDEIRPPTMIESRLHENLTLECGREDANKIEWFRLDDSTKQKELMASGPILQFRNVSLEMTGEFECQIESSDGEKHSYESHVFVDENFFENETVNFAIIQKAQGTPAKLFCRTFAQLNENPTMVEWRRNNSLLESPTDRLYRRTSLITDGPLQGKAIFFSMVQIEDQGIYECSVSHGTTHQRIQQSLLLVQQTTNDTIVNFTMTVDQKRKCFSSHFDVPEEVDHRVAQISTFFLVYYKADLSSDLNIIPGSEAKCTKDGHCTIECWKPPIYFEPATPYTFRLSTVFADTPHMITPLSLPFNVTSWDGTATAAVPFDWLYNPKNGELRIRWEPPTKLSGILTEYHLELVKMDGPPTSGERRLPRLKLHVHPTDTTYSFNLTAPFALKVRLIPITRSGSPASELLNDGRNFGYTLVTIGNEFEVIEEADVEIPPPNLEVIQVSHRAQLDLQFDEPISLEHNATNIKIQYRPLSSLRTMPADSIEVVEQDAKLEMQSDGRKVIRLSDGLKLGMSYQVCAAYERRTDPPIVGFWRCKNAALVDATGRANPIRSEDTFAVSRYSLPKPVNCAKPETNCWCTQSRNDHDLIEVRWKTATSSPKKQNDQTLGVNRPVVTYRLHYTLNESDPEMERHVVDSRLYQVEEESVMEIRGLFPRLTYRIMIEAQNEDGHSVEGQFFECTTPVDMRLPPPTNGQVTLLGGKVAQIQWKSPLPPSALKQIPEFDGYRLYWKQVDGQEQSELIKGHTVNSVMLSMLKPGIEYTAQLSSHSTLFGDSSIRSKTFAIKIPDSKTDNQVSDVPHQILSKQMALDKNGRPTKPPIPMEMLEAERERKRLEEQIERINKADANRPFYLTFRFRAYAFLIIMALLIMGCCACISVLAAQKYYDWKERRDERRRNGFGGHDRLLNDENAFMTAIALQHALRNPNFNQMGNSIHVKRHSNPRRSFAVAAFNSAHSHLLSEAATSAQRQQSFFGRLFRLRGKRAPPTATALSSGRLSPVLPHHRSMNSLTVETIPQTQTVDRNPLNGFLAWAKKKTKRDSVETTGYCPSDDDEPIVHQPIPRPSHLPEIDPKGGPQGHRPRGQRRVQRMINDPEFKMRLNQMNADPTGLGISWTDLMAEMRETQRQEGILAAKRKAEYEAAAIHNQRPSLPTPAVLPYIGEQTRGSLCEGNEVRGSRRAIRQSSNASAPNPPTTSSSQQPNRQRHSRAARTRKHHRIVDSDESEDDEKNRQSNGQRRSQNTKRVNNMVTNLTAINEPVRLHKSNSLVDFIDDPQNPTVGIQNGESRQQEISNSDGNVNGTNLIVIPFRKRPSPNTSLDDLYPATTASSAAPSEMLTPGTPKQFVPPLEDLTPQAPIITTIFAQNGNHLEPRVEFVVGTDEEIRFRLKSAVNPQMIHEADANAKKSSTGTTSMPNLADSGIVYDDFGHPNHQGLHPITSMKLLRENV